MSWIEHVGEYRLNDELISYSDSEINILVHPSHRPVSISQSGNLHNSLLGQDKTLQLYFYSLAWVIPVLLSANQQKIAAALEVIERVFDIPLEQERSGGWNMLWDDHAVSERQCVIIELLGNTAIRGTTIKDKLEDALEKTNFLIDQLVASDKWLNNNHRLFHLFSSFSYQHYKNNKEQSSRIAKQISQFCHDLIDAKTGFAREQCISYCFFDMHVVRSVVKALSSLAYEIDFDMDGCNQKLLHHVNAIAFPDGTLPASGDTPYGLKLSHFQKKHAVPPAEMHEHWARLEPLGFYRGESRTKDVQFLMLQHNGESGHGHHSPLHTDVWFSDFGPVLVDSGGPYKYGDQDRYTWFRALRGHNSLSFDKVDFYPHDKIHIAINKLRDKAAGFLRYRQAAHGRSVFASKNTVKIDEFIFSEIPWKIHYNFAPGIEIVRSTDNKTEFLLEAINGRRIAVSLSSNEVKVDVCYTKRCVGHSLAENAISIVASSPSNVSFFSLTITLVS